MLENYHRRFGGLLGTEEMMQGTEWSPAVDISETDKEYLVRAELPGVEKKDVKISVSNGMLTLHGERQMKKEEKDEKHHRVERFFGNFTRTFTLPDNADESKINAQFKDGILTLHMPKTKPSTPEEREITIQ